MRKIFTIIFLSFLFLWNVNASEELKIISRSEWWANESYRYLDWPEWQEIFKKREEANQRWRDKLASMSEYERQIQEEKSRKASEKTKEANNILMTEYYDDNKIVSTVREESWNKLAWPITKTEKIKWIIVHHTLWNYKTSEEWVRSIYKFHALSREWWDIWYNYLIWKDWEIYEWRAWGDYVIAAHSIWNNRSTIWIAMIGDYSSRPISEIQHKALENLIWHLVKKYNIDVTKKFDYHKECKLRECDQALESYKLDPIVGHRDSGHTSCPWDALYHQIHEISENFITERRKYIKSRIYLAKVKKHLQKKIDIMPENNSLKLLEYAEKRLEKEKKETNIELLEIIKSLVKEKFKEETEKSLAIETEKNPKIKVRLSYPHEDKIDIKTINRTYNITRKWNNLFVDGQKYRVFNIDWKNSEYLEISSWDRVPVWDSSWEYNDNKFRWDLIIYVKDSELVVVNKLPLEDYLKWLWEVSDFEDPEKIKTIIIAARTYAKWYISEARKFPSEWYDWSDNPDVFQKYLWYSLEQRSPNVNKIVEETAWSFITYNGELIKPWYSSSTWWKTLSYKEYCLNRVNKDLCEKESKKYPYLSSVKDPWSVSVPRNWHWVWISWIWTKYFAEKWWTAEMIIKYFLNWVEISKIQKNLTNTKNNYNSNS